MEISGALLEHNWDHSFLPQFLRTQFFNENIFFIVIQIVFIRAVQAKRLISYW